MKARNRFAAEHERAADEYRSEGRKQAAEQQRKIARSHFAGRAQGISARGEDGDHGEAAEHHAGPEILRRADSHDFPHAECAATGRSNRLAVPPSMARTVLRAACAIWIGTAPSSTLRSPAAAHGSSR